MKNLKNFKGLLTIVTAMTISIGSAYSQLEIIWNDTEVPPRARDAFKNNTEHTAVSTYGFPPQTCGASGTPCAMNVGVPVCLTVQDVVGTTLTNIAWSFGGTNQDVIKDYIINSKRDYGEGFLTVCKTIPINTNTLFNQHMICFYYTGTGESEVTVSALGFAPVTITFEVVRNPKAETYYMTGALVYLVPPDPAVGFNTPLNFTEALEGEIAGAPSGVDNIPGLDRDNLLGIHHLWDDEIQSLPTTMVIPGESFRFHRYYIQAASCWRTIFGYDCIEPYISGQYDDPNDNPPNCFGSACRNNVPSDAGDPVTLVMKEGSDHFGTRCNDANGDPDPDCALLNGTGDGIVEGDRFTFLYDRIEKLPRRFSLDCNPPPTTTYSCCCHLNLDPGANLSCTGANVPETACASGPACVTSGSNCIAPTVACDYDMVGNNLEITLVDFANENDLAQNIVQYHNRMHDNVCHFGDFTNEWTTPADPFFFRYHATLQRVYQLWQYLKLDDNTLTTQSTNSSWTINNGIITVDATSLNPAGAFVHYPDPDFTGFTEFEAGTCTNLPDEVFSLSTGQLSGTFFTAAGSPHTITGTVKDVVLLDPNFDNINFTQGEGCTQTISFQIVINTPPTSDVYIQDDPFFNPTPTDNGFEPNTASYNPGYSKDIWVIDNTLPTTPFSNSVDDHMNPEKGQENYVYVQLHNDGTPIQGAPEDISGHLRIYWGNTSTGLSWPSTFELIDEIPVDIDANTSKIVRVIWTPEIEGHHCLIAIWASGLDPSNPAPAGFGTNIAINVKNNNNAAQKNVNIVDNVGHHQKNENTFIIRNTAGTAVNVDLEINGATFLNNGNICIDLGQTLFNNWQGNGGAGTNIQLPGGFVVCADLAQPMVIQGIPMAAGEEHEVIISFQADPVCLNGGRLGPFYVEVVQSEDGIVVGGIIYQVAIGDRPDCVTPPSDMISWWTGDYPGDNLDAVDIQNRNNGTRVNEVEFGEGRVDRAFVLDGVNDYIRVPNDPSLNFGDDNPSGSGDFTIDAWIFLHRTIGRQVIVDKRTDSPVRGYSLFLQDGKLGFGITDANGVYQEFITRASAELGEWSHVALTVDRDGDHILYLDGNIADVFVPTGLTDIDNNADLIIGRESDAFGGGFLHAAIDEVEIYSRALDAAEIQDIYGAGSSGKCKDILLLIASITGTNISTNGGNDGAVDITITGGAAPLTFAWSNGATTEDLSALTAGTYTVDVTDAHGCTETATITLTEPTVICPVPIGVVHTNETLVSSTTFTGDHTVIGTLTVSSGTVLTINNSSVEFAGNGSIVVEPGARLNVNHSALLACNNTWRGIEVRGNSKLPQTPNHQGVVSINNSTVEDALIGVFAGRWVNYLQNIDIAKSGGIVKVFNNSKMENNVIHIFLSKYNQKSKQMKIMNSQFDQTNLSFSFSLIPKHILVEGTNGLVIQGNSFEGGKLGIEINSTKELQILKNIFTNVTVAISGIGNKELVIFDNTFGDGVEIGIDLAEGETFKFHKNKFDHAREAIRTRESIPGNKRSEITENIFNQPEIAIKFRDDNHSNLDIRCNEFNNYTKYAIKSYNTIMADQGKQQKGAGNTFIPNTSLAYNCFDHTGTGFTYHYDPMHVQEFSDPNVMSPTVTKGQANVNNGCVRMPHAKTSNTDSGGEETIQSALDETIYEGYSLSNYPNPFKDGTIIAAYVPGMFFNSEIVVYNIVGSVISKFPLKPGHNFIEVKSNDLNPGIYFYSLMSDRTKIETKKMVHLK